MRFNDTRSGVGSEHTRLSSQRLTCTYPELGRLAFFIQCTTPVKYHRTWVDLQCDRMWFTLTADIIKDRGRDKVAQNTSTRRLQQAPRQETVEAAEQVTVRYFILKPSASRLTFVFSSTNSSLHKVVYSTCTAVRTTTAVLVNGMLCRCRMNAVRNLLETGLDPSETAS